jgi:hypothetical protein
MTAIQPKRNRAEHLKPHQFKPGQSGNLSGKPKGAISMKTRAANYLATLNKKEALEFLQGMDKADVWKMAEGNPTAEIKGDLVVNYSVSEAIAKKHNDPQSSTE